MYPNNLAGIKPKPGWTNLAPPCHFGGGAQLDEKELGLGLSSGQSSAGISRQVAFFCRLCWLALKFLMKRQRHRRGVCKKNLKGCHCSVQTVRILKRCSLKQGTTNQNIIDVHERKRQFTQNPLNHVLEHGWAMLDTHWQNRPLVLHCLIHTKIPQQCR